MHSGLGRRWRRRIRALLASGALLLLIPVSALGQDTAARAEATDLVYEAADALDQARAEFDAGRRSEGERLLSRAERDLERAAELDPSAPRLGFEQARLQQLDGQPLDAELVLTEWMLGDLPFGEHVRSVDLLNDIRGELGRPTVGVEWTQAQQLRNAGIGVLAGGLVASLVGVGIGFGTFAEEAYSGVTDKGIGGNRFGWGLAIGGAGVALGGGGMTLAGQLKVARLRRILPGPWRLTGDPGLLRPPVHTARNGQTWVFEIGFAFGAGGG
ncbi:MAG: hypothetical protein KDA24_20525 [Deltaproteobacteria bacterium]|nr:hypothetical protein [Deltaproteobacteria bacterium]